MANPTLMDIQPIDPIITNLVMGYKQADDRFVAAKVFPPAPLDHVTGQYFIFTKKYWFINEMVLRAPGGPYKRSDFSVSTSTVTTLQYALSYPMADEIRQNSMIPLDLESAASMWLAQKSLLNKEVYFAANFMTTSVWGTDFTGGTTGAKWDDYTGSDPVGNVKKAVRTISDNTGTAANTLVLGNAVDDAVQLHPDVIDRLKYTQAATAGNVANAIADMLGVKNYLVGKATYSNTNEAATFSATNIIGKAALVCVVDPASGIFGATAGKTFFWQGGGGLGEARKWRDEANDADLLKYKEQWTMAATASDQGYYFTTIVS